VKTFLKLLFAAIFVWMIVMTIRTSMRMSLGAAFATFGDNPWAVATLWDAYFGFLTFYVWVFWKESRVAMRVLWFVLIMCLGNIAMSFYVLLELMRLGKDQPAHAILRRREA
jgi:hypothetical protein